MLVQALGVGAFVRVHLAVGQVHQFFDRVVLVGVEGHHADTDRKLEGMQVLAIRDVQRLLQTGTNVIEMIGVGLDGENGEFVTADPGHDV